MDSSESAPIIRGGLILLLVAVGACQATPQALRAGEARDERVKRQSAERFHARHSIAGKTAFAVVDEMKGEGFSCWIEYRHRLPEAGGTRSAPWGRYAMLYCSRWDPRPGVPCLEERVAYDVDWRDPGAEGEALAAQLATSTLSAQVHTCVPGR